MIVLQFGYDFYHVAYSRVDYGAVSVFGARDL
jgi:hypothetical protein